MKLEAIFKARSSDKNYSLVIYYEEKKIWLVHCSPHFQMIDFYGIYISTEWMMVFDDCY